MLLANEFSTSILSKFSFINAVSMLPLFHLDMS